MPTCDADGDGAVKGGAACAPPAGTKADCDDTDPRVKPGADFVRATWPASSPHPTVDDWNCDGAVTKELPFDVSCAALDGCTQGFASNVACGTSGTYNVCKRTTGVLGALLCAVDHTETRTQGCR